MKYAHTVLACRRSVVAGVCALALGTSVAGVACAQSEIKVGLTTDLTGIAAGYTRSTVTGAELAIDEINAAGGLLGRKLVLLVRDSQLKPDLGTTHTRDLILREKVDFLIGPNASSVGLTVSAVAKQYQKIVLMTTPNTPRLPMELFHPHLFTIVPSGLMEARAMAEVLAPKGKKFAFIGGDYEASHQGLKYFKEWLAKVNPSAEFVTEAWPKLGEPDFTSYITRLISAKPDVVFSYLWGADLIGFIKQAKPYGLFERMTVGTLLFMDDLKALGQEMPDGILGQMRAPFFALSGDQVDKFVERYRAKYNEYPADWAIMAYEAMTIYADVIRKAQSVEAAAMIKAMEAGEFNLLRGKVKFRTLDHQGNVPSFIGKVTKSDKYPFKVMTEVRRVDGEKIWPSEAEVLESRKPK